MSKRQATISEVLRQVIVDSGESAASIERATGVSNANLSRFLRGERGLALVSVDRLAEHFGLSLVKRKGTRHERKHQ